MKIRSTIGILIAVIGAVSIGFSQYIANQVESGREQIAEAKENVKKGKSLFSLNPISEQVGKPLTGAAEKKIAAGSAKADEYERMSGYFKIGGMVLVVAGVVIFLLGKKKK